MCDSPHASFTVIRRIGLAGLSANNAINGSRSQPLRAARRSLSGPGHKSAATAQPPSLLRASECADRDEAVPITLKSTPASEDWECAYAIEFRISQSVSGRNGRSVQNIISGEWLSHLGPLPPA